MRAQFETIALLLVALLLSCGDSGPVELIVDLKTDLLVPRELDRIEVDIDGDTVLDESADETIDYLAGARVVEATVLPGDVRIDVRLRRGEQLVLARTVRVRVETDTGVTVLMTRDCLDTACDDPMAPACVAGSCAPETCSVETPETCPAPECDTDTDCGPQPTCVAARCVDGACLLSSDVSACPTGELCVPEVGCAARSRGAGPSAQSVARISGQLSDHAFDAVTHPLGGFVATGRAGGESTTFSFTGPFPTRMIDAFVGRFSADASLDWVEIIGAASDDADEIRDEGRAVKVDAAGNVYVAGSVAGDVDFGGTMTMATSGAPEEAFVASWTEDGTFRWVTRASGRSSAADLVLDDAGSIWAVGAFLDMVTIDGRSLSTDGYDFFLIQLDSTTGAALGATSFGGAGTDLARAITLGSGGELVIAASFQVGVGFGTSRSPSGGSGIGWLAPGGALLREHVITGAAVNDVAVTGDDRTVVVGETTSASLSVGGETFADVEERDIFVASLDATGDLEWLTTAGGRSSDGAASVAVDAAGNSYIVGSFENAVDLGGGGVYSVGSDDIFVASFGPAGAHRWTLVYGGEAMDGAHSVSWDPSSSGLVIGAAFQGTDPVDFDGIAVDGGGEGTGVVLVLQ